MLMDSVGQELGKGTAGTACSCSIVSGASIEKPQSLGVARQLGWTHLKHVSSHVWYLGWKDTETKPTESTHSPSTWRGFLTAWRPGLDLLHGGVGLRTPVPRGQGRSFTASCAPALEITQRCFHHILLVTSKLNEEGHGCHLLIGEWQGRWACGMELLLQPWLENTIDQSSIIYHQFPQGSKAHNFQDNQHA